jgi:hypothetical protein
VVYRHIVLFRLHDDVDEIDVERAADALTGLASDLGLDSWRIERSIDVRKGRILVEDATFVDRSAFERFRATPEHARVAAMMSRISDWWVGDYAFEEAATCSAQPS